MIVVPNRVARNDISTQTRSVFESCVWQSVISPGTSLPSSRASGMKNVPVFRPTYTTPASMKTDPANVYKNSVVAARRRSRPPQMPTMKNSGTSDASKKT